MKKSILTKNQKKCLSPRLIDVESTQYYIYPVIRYDDECNNGHNTFSITCTITTERGKVVGGGCCHEEFSRAYPEYAHLIKWHLCSSDGPLHYIANTLYHASNSTSLKYKVGEPNQWEKVLKFRNSNITHTFDKKFIEFLEENKNRKDFKIVEIQYKGESNYNFSPHYTLEGYHNISWTWCPFTSRREAEEYTKELNTKKWVIKKIITGYQ